MKPIRVARIITRLNVGGPAYQATLLNHRLPSLGYECLLIYGAVANGETSFDRLLEEYPGKTVFCPSLKRKIGAADAAALVQLVQILKNFKPDIVHTHTAKAGLLGRIAGRIAGAKATVHTYHGHVLEGYFSRPMEKMILQSERTLARWTDKLIAVSERLRGDLVERFGIAPAEKFETVELGLPLERFLHLPQRGTFRRANQIEENAVVLGTLGRLVPVKNHGRMLKVFESVVKRFPERKLHLVIGGTGPLEDELKRTVRAMGLGERVHFPGLVNDLAEFYANIDIALLTSDNEGTPVTLLEAMAAGKCVVAPDVGGIGDVVDAEVGKVVKPNTMEAYVEAISEILNRETTALPQELRMKTVQRFSPDRLVKDMDTLYRNILRDKGKFE